MVIEHFKTGRRPYRILFHPDGKSFFVTHWADGTVGQYDTATGSLMATVRVGAASHRHGLARRRGGGRRRRNAAWAARLFVAAANTNNVYAVGVNAAKDVSVVETINIAMTPRQPLGMTPCALGLSADGKRLFVACSDANAVAVVDISEARSRVRGFIPTGWYPTAVRALRRRPHRGAQRPRPALLSQPQNGPNPTKRPNRCTKASPRRPPYSSSAACRPARPPGSSPSPTSSSIP